MLLMAPSWVGRKEVLKREERDERKFWPMSVGVPGSKLDSGTHHGRRRVEMSI
jgi:hypothetical protein